MMKIVRKQQIHTKKIFAVMILNDLVLYSTKKSKY